MKFQGLIQVWDAKVLEDLALEWEMLFPSQSKLVATSVAISKWRIWSLQVTRRLHDNRGCNTCQTQY